MKKIAIFYEGKDYEFSYYNSWMDEGHHLFFTLTDNNHAAGLLQLDHFFIHVDLLKGGRYTFNILKNTLDEVAFKDVIARKVLDHHYQAASATHLN